MNDTELEQILDNKYFNYDLSMETLGISKEQFIADAKEFMRDTIKEIAISKIDCPDEG
jgi:hypothetical protein